MEINKESLKDLFNSALYLKIVESSEVKKNPFRASRRMNSEPSSKKILQAFSPKSADILATFSPDTQMRLARDFIKDEEYIKSQVDKLELDDPNYLNYNNPKVGSDLEYWVCVNITCPGCKGTLYKYASPSMPAVDVRCINPNHTLADGPKYYQIKATESGKTFNGYKYFSYDDKYICVGSVRFGYNCHVMTYDDKYKDILIGYICLAYNYINDNKITLDKIKSFILIPNLLFTPSNDEEKVWTYYEYIQLGSSPIIRFNSNMVDLHRLPTDINPEISLNIIYDAQKITQEPPTGLDLKSKYLIMKMKYLNLKNKLYLT